MASFQTNHLHPLLIGQEEMSIIFQNFILDLHLSTRAHAESIFAKLFRVDSFVKENHLIAEIKLPKPMGTRFKWYKVYLLPMIINNASFVYNIETEYLATNLEQNLFMLEKGNYLANCNEARISQEEKILVCKQNSPMVLPTSNDCTTNLFTENNLSICETKTTPTANLLTPLTQKGSWLMSFPTDTTLRFTTDNGSTKTINFQGQATLQIFKTCTVQIGKLYIEYHADVLREIHIKHVKPNMKILERLNNTKFNFPETLEQNMEVVFPPPNKYNDILLQNGKLLTDIEREIKQHEKSKQLQKEQQIIKISFPIIIVCILLIALLWYRFKKSSCKKTPTPDIELGDFSSRPRRQQPEYRSLPNTQLTI